MSDNMTAPPNTRTDCAATWHDSAAAYRKAGCRCPKARTAESARKKKYDANRGPRPYTARLGHIALAAEPPFRLDPRRNCADLPDPDVMFPESASKVPDALAVCKGCPLTRACAQWAIDTRQRYGVYGGMSETQRLRTIREQVTA